MPAKQVQGLGDITACHAGAELPGDHVTGEVIQYRRQIHPAPADDLQVREVGLPHLIDARGLIFKLTGGLHVCRQRPWDRFSSGLRESFCSSLPEGLR